MEGGKGGNEDSQLRLRRKLQLLLRTVRLVVGHCVHSSSVRCHSISMQHNYRQSVEVKVEGGEGGER